MKRSASVLMSGVVAALVLGACSSTPAITGGDTSCKDFLAADDNTKTEAITKMLKDEKGSDAANLEITGTKLAVQTWCQTAGTPETKIKNAPHL
ncbi:MAG: acid stress chaperone HdeA [Mycobacterium sp.]|jgi:acid stress chaperone HdeA|nr:acid stress chaperone HdeA [Mycobacterium sp.]